MPDMDEVVTRRLTPKDEHDFLINMFDAEEQWVAWSCELAPELLPM